MRTAGWLLGSLAIAVFIVITVIKQLNTDASPAVAICAQAERQGLTCKVGAKTYQAQIVATDDGAGTAHVFLVVEEGKTVVTVITLQ